MTEPTMTAMDWLVALLTFPRIFQVQVLAFASGAGDPLYLEVFKRSFLLLPAAALMFCLWASIPNLCSLLFRSRRLEFLNGFLSAWWDLGHTAFAYMAGLIRAVLLLTGQILAVLRMALAGMWMLLMDLLLAPFRAVRAVGRNVAAPGLPWIATVMTVAWCILEAVIFTYVMTPLVMDTLNNLTGQELREYAIRIPLFLFLLTLVLGSYAVLAAWTKAIAERDIASIVRITAVECVAVLLEILFLYREFVDALVPWFAMHSSKNFEPSAAVILGIAFMIWLGVRGMTWFLFASHGTPILMAVIQGKGLGAPAEGGSATATEYFGYSGAYYAMIRHDADWLSARGEELLGALLVPPLQLLAACLNFLTLLVSGKPAFQLPFKNLAELLEAAKALRPSNPRGGRGEQPQPPRVAVEVKP